MPTRVWVFHRSNMEDLTGNLFIDPLVNFTFLYKCQTKKGTPPNFEYKKEISAVERLSSQRKEFPVKGRKFLFKERNS